ncbi:MAG TPA: TIGR03767 family metallophosphoesterase [Jatrophihabitantaceae bacterium]|nr:TIGR03767 family metallophosphoesterase [Jatrophihabitantaceae bacterium]
MTTERTIRGGAAGEGGYRPLVAGPGEPHQHRTELAPAPARLGTPTVTIAHLSDLHLCDAQSPARAEFLDRWVDPDSALRGHIQEIGTYRAQEMMSAHVAEAMTRALNAIDEGPVGGAPVDFGVVTGDNTDNAQANELDWYLALLDGGTVRPDSGDLTRYEGVADDVVDDERHWHPNAVHPDLPRMRYGLPEVPGLLDAVRAPFDATGLDVPWLAVHGNHDQLLQGTVPGSAALAAVAVGATKAVGLPAHWTDDAIIALVAGLARCDPAALEALGAARTRPVTPDPARRIITRDQFVEAHFHDRARPKGHGFAADGRAYYRHDHGDCTVLVMDTVDEHGGWDGSLDAEQLEWLESEMDAADREHRYVILASHHPLRTMVNDTWAAGTPSRVLGAEFDAVLARHPSVVMWLNGHTHHTGIVAHGSWWEITTPSLIDWPQQSRIVEVLRSDGTLTIATTMVDHCGSPSWDSSIDAPLALASLSRELAANDWQSRSYALEQSPRAGTAADRNVLLHLRDPWQIGA